MTSENFREEIYELLSGDTGEEETLKKITNIAENNIPDKLYKYYSINEGCHSCSLKNIRDETLWLSLPEMFNDPYECYLFYKPLMTPDKVFKKSTVRLIFENAGKKVTKSELKKIVKSARNARAENLDSEETVRLITKILTEKKVDLNIDVDDLVKNILNAINGNQHEFIENVRKTTTICSLSESNNSILMWSHYADNHRGFVVEYNTHELILDEKKPRIFPIIYNNDIHNISNMIYGEKKNEVSPTFIYGAASIKHKDWCYEKEWRIILQGIRPKNNGFPIKVSTPIAIYLGTKISDENKKLIFTVAKEKGINVFQMNMKTDKYELFYTQKDRIL